MKPMGWRPNGPDFWGVLDSSRLEQEEGRN